MLDTRIPIIHRLDADLKSAEVYLSADVHCGSAQFSSRKWGAFEKLLSADNAFVVFAGDQMEYATRTSKSDVYTQRLSPREQKDWWIEHLKPLKNKVLCIVDGNHEFNRASKDADCFPLYDIALALGIEDRYRSEACFVDISIGTNKIDGRHRQTRYIGRITHRAQNLVNYGTADAFEGIDFFVSGRTHKPADRPLGKIVYDTRTNQIREKTVENVVCGHFLDYGGYSERSGYRPTSQKLYKIIIDGDAKNIQTVGFHI